MENFKILNDFLGVTIHFYDLLVTIIGFLGVFFVASGFWSLVSSTDFKQKGRSEVIRKIVAGLALSSFAGLMHIVSQTMFKQDSDSRELLLGYIQKSSETDAWQDVVWSTAFILLILIGIWTGLRTLSKLAKPVDQRKQGDSDGKLLIGLFASGILINSPLVLEVIKKTIGV